LSKAAPDEARGRKFDKVGRRHRRQRKEPPVRGRGRGPLTSLRTFPALTVPSGDFLNG
jgi:hypothetical protein